MTTIDEFLNACKQLDLLDGEAGLAWQLVKESLFPTPFPPRRLGRLYDAAAGLAQQSTKTGLMTAWRRPPRHSQAMEQLVQRITTVLEAFLDLYQVDAGADPAEEGERFGTAYREAIASTIVDDELYQPGYCDECGTILHPDGLCIVCEWKLDKQEGETS